MPQVMQQKITKRVIYGLVGATLVSAFLLASYNYVSADERSAEATAVVRVASTCSMTAHLDAAHVATLVNGIYSGSYNDGSGQPYANGIGKTTITTHCNDQNGYSIYAVGFSNDTKGDNKLHGIGLGGTHDIATGTATSGNTSNWAMKLTAVAGTYQPTIQGAFGNYAAVPTDYTEVVRLTKATNPQSMGASAGSTITTTYAAYISNTQPAGTYVGKVKYMLVHPNSTVAPSAYRLQNIADWKNDLELTSEIVAYDERDNKPYTVRKMDDGNIWMTQNLDLCIGCEGTAALTSDNTDISSDEATYGTSGIYSDYVNADGTYIWMPDTTAYTSNHVISGTSVPGWTNSQTEPYSAEGGDTYYYTSGSTDSDTIYSSLSGCTGAGHTADECKHYHAGNYYNWSAAIASNDSTNISASGTKATNSICPKDWRLPVATSPREFGNLLYAYDAVTSNSGGYATNGLNIMRSTPLFFVRSGYVNGGSLSNRASHGDYWSSQAYSSTLAYYLDFDSSDIYSANGGGRYYGFSVRCVAR